MGEQGTLNPKVAGSNPAAPTKRKESIVKEANAASVETKDACTTPITVPLARKIARRFHEWEAEGRPRRR